MGLFRPDTVFALEEKTRPLSRAASLVMSNAELREAQRAMQTEAAKYAMEAINNLVYLMRNPDSPKIALAATKELLDRAFGRPKENVEIEGGTASALLSGQTTVQVVFVKSNEPPTNNLDNPPGIKQQPTIENFSEVPATRSRTWQKNPEPNAE